MWFASKEVIKLLIAYDSKTGNVRRFVNKLNMEIVQIDETMILSEPFVLITYTTGFGQVPKKVLDFLQNNHQNMIAVAGSGNRNWGDNFCKSARTISERHNVPIIHMFELSGTKNDVNKFIDGVNSIETHRIK